MVSSVTPVNSNTVSHENISAVHHWEQDTTDKRDVSVSFK